MSVVKSLQSRVDERYTFDSFHEAASHFEKEDTFEVVESKNGLQLYNFAHFQSIGCRRTKNEVVSIHALVLDIDGKPRSDFEMVAERLDAMGVSYWWHTTFSHTGSREAARLRLVVALRRAVHNLEWPVFWSSAVAFMGAEDLVDSSCSDSCRIYYPPCAKNREFYEFKYVPNAGEGLDVDHILKCAPADVLKALKPYEVLPENERGVVSEALRENWRQRRAYLCQQIKERGPGVYMYDLKNNAVFGLGVGCPHILPPEEVRGPVLQAFSERYEKFGTPELLEKTAATITKAIEDGMQKPWWPARRDERNTHTLDADGLASRMREADGFLKLIWVKNAGWWFFKETCWVAGEEEALGFALETGKNVTKEADLFLSERYFANEKLKKLEEDATTKLDVKAHAEATQKARDVVTNLEKQYDRIEKFVAECRRGQHLPYALSFYKSRVSAPNMRGFDANPELFNFSNGTLDLRTLKLRPHNPMDYLTTTSEFAYDPNLSCPRFDAFMREVTLGDAELEHLLWMCCGYSMTGDTSEQKFMMLYGGGADGKSVFLGVLQDVFGEKGALTNVQNVMKSKQGDGNERQHPAWLMALRGKRFVWCEEPDNFKALNEAELKSITGSRLLTARGMGENFSSFEPEVKLWMGTNHKPKINNVDHGIWRRIAPIPFSARFETEEEIAGAKIRALEAGEDPEKATSRLKVRDPYLAGALRKEAPAILSKLARYANRFLLGEKPKWDILKANLNEYRNESFPLAAFLEERCVSLKALKNREYEDWSQHMYELCENSDKPWNTERKTLYEAYQNWEKSPKQMSRKVFYEFMEEKFTATKYAGVRRLKGVRPLTDIEMRFLKSGVFTDRERTN